MAWVLEAEVRLRLASYIRWSASVTSSAASRPWVKILMPALIVSSKRPSSLWVSQSVIFSGDAPQLFLRPPDRYREAT